MRETKLNVFYYPGAELAQTTLKKAMLLFDELHITDQPAFTFNRGHCGFIGVKSSLRGFETLFREHGFPVYVHTAPSGLVDERGGFYEDISADVNDLQFLRGFQRGLETSETFRQIHVAHGEYGENGNQDEVAQKLITVDLDSALKLHGSPMALFEDLSVPTMGFSSHLECCKNLIFQAIGCSAKLNLALNLSASIGIIPLADAPPFRDLLGAKYGRAINRLSMKDNEIPLTDLSFAIFDEIVPAERLKNWISRA